MDLWRAENKLVQLAVARHLGIHTPRTCVVGHRDLIPVSFGSRVVVKPLGPGAFTSDAGDLQVVFARLLDRDTPELDALGAAPFLIQECLEPEAHLRIVTVDERAWVFLLDAPSELDWRENDDAHHSFRPTGNHADVSVQALAITGALDVGYSSQDWIVTRDGSVRFIDLNPGGQWLFLPESGAAEVSAAIAAWLTEEIG